MSDTPWDLTGETADEVAARFDALGTDETAFAALVSALEVRGFTKAKTCDVAEAVTGGRAGMWKSKKDAIEAIRTKFQERVYQASKLAGVDKATPW